HAAKQQECMNVLELAQRAAARVLDRTAVSELRERGDGTWEVTLERTGAWTTRGKRPRTMTAAHVVVAAGTWGTQHLLHYAKDSGSLPRLSGALGRLTRTNSESILGAMGDKYRPERDFSEGVAITSSFHPASDTHIEPVRYGKGSNAIAVLQTLLTDGGGRVPRWLLLILEILRNPLRAAKMFNYRRWSQRTVIVLVMQNLDNSLQTFVKRLGPFRYVSSRQGHGEPNPSWIPKGNEATRRLADKIDGTPGGTVGDIFNMPMTAHFLGGCPISDSPDEGVVDPYHR